MGRPPGGVLRLAGLIDLVRERRTGPGATGGSARAARAPGSVRSGLLAPGTTLSSGGPSAGGPDPPGDLRRAPSGPGRTELCFLVQLRLGQEVWPA
ncbi:hypothetical protein NDU88_005492 [Pleurodeles waltl]|uniref:Uncharacterized protein n=1 Tax=Pleurodeles waltl TaxID=8319 RepID=A0AAV7VMS8_PLEWA|nr:hypothetical protein NDU88_005492 [Pleurodeles waltl]